MGLKLALFRIKAFIVKSVAPKVSLADILNMDVPFWPPMYASLIILMGRPLY